MQRAKCGRFLIPILAGLALGAGCRSSGEADRAGQEPAATGLGRVVPGSATPVQAEPRLDWAEIGPLEYLALLQERQTGVGRSLELNGAPVTLPPFVTIWEPPPEGWLAPRHVDALLAVAASTEPCAGTVSSLSSVLPRESSSVGREALFLVEGYRRGRYPPALSSVDAIVPSLGETRAWWRRQRGESP
ncbi:MAG: hypothetical protein AAF628_17510 [Planctomycetota bacterium]